MGLNFVRELVEDESGAIIYTSSAPLDYYIRKKLKEKLDADSEYIFNIETDKELTSTIDNGLTAPMIGSKWVMHVNLAKITAKQLEKVIKRDLPYAYYVFWTDDFRIFNKVKQMEVVKKNEQYYRVESLNYLTPEDAAFYLEDSLKEEYKNIQPNIKDFVIRNYRFDLKGLADYIQLIAIGEEFNDTKEIVDAIGVGSISVDTLLIKILTADASTPRKEKNRLKDLLGYYNMLKTKYEPKTILNYLDIGATNLLLLKQLHILGYMKNHNVEMPSYVDVKRLKRYNRFTHILQKDVTLVDILNFKLTLRKYKGYDSELVYMQVIMDYLKNRRGDD